MKFTGQTGGVALPRRDLPARQFPQPRKLRRTLTLRPELRGRLWVRLEVWDIATNGAFTQPVWLTAE